MTRQPLRSDAPRNLSELVASNLRDEVKIRWHSRNGIWYHATILHIDIRIEMRYNDYTEMHLTKCDVSMNMKMSSLK